VHAEVVSRITAGIEAYGLRCRGVTESPIKGDKAGNTEFLAHFTHGAGGAARPIGAAARVVDGGAGGAGSSLAS
jgi:23S rRNA (cytidine1920-2'-O)/16S rRNA (cytidine1409-2'-O)-methyltransferase